MQIDAGIVAIFITVLISLLGLAAAWGRLWEKVKQNRDDIHTHKNELKEEIAKLHKENKSDHQTIFSDLNEIKKEMYRRNGNSK